MTPKPKAGQAKLRRDILVAADPYVCEAFADLMLAAKNRNRPGKMQTADRLERSAFKCLVHYLATLEPLPVSVHKST